MHIFSIFACINAAFPGDSTFPVLKTVKLSDSNQAEAGLLPPDKSILFINPDFHCSFFLRDEFRRIGWRADVLEQDPYPKELLFSDDYITDGSRLRNSRLGRITNRIIFFLKLIQRYKYFLVYGSPEVYLILNDVDCV